MFVCLGSWFLLTCWCCSASVIGCTIRANLLDPHTKANRHWRLGCIRCVGELSAHSFMMSKHASILFYSCFFLKVLYWFQRTSSLYHFPFKVDSFHFKSNSFQTKLDLYKSKGIRAEKGNNVFFYKQVSIIHLYGKVLRKIHALFEQARNCYPLDQNIVLIPFNVKLDIIHVKLDTFK